jgi:4-diphosphocytidyl-2-C-methyl-D-erythritol kinase
MIARLAPAKINLALHVTGRRADGYHLLESLVVFTRFGDRVEIAEAEADRFDVDGPFAKDVPADVGNLVLQARDRLRSLLVASTTQERETPTVAIRLTKNLSVASGVGGGSSDAAATLQALASLWDIEQATIDTVAAELGADVPMCLAAYPLVAKGIGHDVTPLPDFPALPLVLINAGLAISTPEVFRALTSRENAPLPPLASKLTVPALIQWLRATRNDLETPAVQLAPIIADSLAALLGGGAAFARMSGSGATCFGLFDSLEQAEAAAAAIRRTRPGWFVVSTASTASGETFDGEA